VALSAARMKEWMGADLSDLDIMVVQIDGIHIRDDLVLVAALGIDSEDFKHPLGLMEGATEHCAVVQALIDDPIERGLDPAVPRLFIIDGSKALAKAIRHSFGRSELKTSLAIHEIEVFCPQLIDNLTVQHIGNRPSRCASLISPALFMI
jgi:putative transposase